MTFDKNKVIKEVDSLVSKANEEYGKDATMDDYDVAATQDITGGDGFDADVAAMDNQGDTVQIGDLVDLTNGDKVKGIVKEIGRQILIEWPDGDETEEEAIAIVLHDVDDEEDDDYDIDDDEDDDYDDEDEDEDDTVYPTSGKSNESYLDEGVEDDEEDEDVEPEISGTVFPGQ
jgi:hypothetical protein